MAALYAQSVLTAKQQLGGRCHYRLYKVQVDRGRSQSLWHPGLGEVAVLQVDPVAICSSQGHQGLSHRALPLP